jgi:Flp pilus assembly protein TadD
MRTTTSAHRIVFWTMTLVLVAGTLQAKSPLERLNPFSWGSSKSSDKPEPVPQPTASQKAELQMTLARSLEREDKLEQAIVIYNDLLKKDDDRIEAYQRSAIVNDQLGNFEESDKLYRAALKREPKNAELHCDRGYSLYLQDRDAEAEKTLRQALTLNPRLARAHNNLALVLAHNGKDEQALAEFSQGGCHEADARVNLAFCLMARKEWIKARQQLELASTADPNAPAIGPALAYLRAKAPAQVAGTVAAISRPEQPIAKTMPALMDTIPPNTVATTTSYEVAQFASELPFVTAASAPWTQTKSLDYAVPLEQAAIERRESVAQRAYSDDKHVKLVVPAGAPSTVGTPPEDAAAMPANPPLGVASPRLKSEIRFVVHREPINTLKR